MRGRPFLAFLAGVLATAIVAVALSVAIDGDTPEADSRSLMNINNSRCLRVSMRRRHPQLPYRSR